MFGRATCIIVVVLVVLLAFFPLAFSEGGCFHVLFSQFSWTRYRRRDCKSGLHSGYIDKLPYDGCPGGGKSDTGVVGLGLWSIDGEAGFQWFSTYRLFTGSLLDTALPNMEYFPNEEPLEGWVPLCFLNSRGLFSGSCVAIAFSYACFKTRPFGDAEPHGISSQCMAVGK